MKYFNKNIKGFTLIELMVALGLFVVILTITISILLYALRVSNHVSNQIRAIDNIFLAIEQIIREIRTGSNIRLTTSGFTNTIEFTGFNNDPVTYSFCDTRICRNGLPITTANTIITGGFIISDFNGTKTPRITISARATDTRGNLISTMQTTVSARLIHYKQPE